MGFFYIDSFDDRTSIANYEAKFSSFSGSQAASSVAGRTGNAMQWRLTGGALAYLRTTFAAQATVAVGFALKDGASRSGTTKMFQWLDGANEQLTLSLTNTGTLILKRGATTLVTTSAVISSSSFNYIEVIITFNTSSGSYTIYNNGSSIATASGVNTSNNGTNQCTSVQIQDDWGQNMIFDDYYVATSIQGNLKIECLFPTANGTTNQWTPSTGSNWQNVDDTDPNSGSDYNSDFTVNDIDLYTMQDLSTLSVTVACIQQNMNAAIDIAGTRSIAPVIRSGGANYVGSNFSLGTSYAYNSQIRETDPATGVAWTPAGVNALEAGVKVTV